MTRTEYLLWCLAEECNEVAQRASKAARFGLSEKQPGQHADNRERLRAELNDLEAVWRELHSIIDLSTSAHLVGAKQAKIREYMNYSRKLGILEDE